MTYDSTKKSAIKKKNIKYNLNYISSSIKTKAFLGTIEKDASAKYGFHKKEKFRAEAIAKYFVKKKFKHLLDIGSGDQKAAEFFFKKKKKIDIIELKNSYYFKKPKKFLNKMIYGDFSKIKGLQKYDGIWCSHTLEHQSNVQIFLEKIYSTLKVNGYLCIIVPPRKPFIISGHLNLFNPGLLIYRLILAGFDCKKAELIQYDYNICIIIKKDKKKVKKNLRMDVGDLKKLKNFFPFSVNEGFNGDIMKANISSKIYNLILKNEI